ncbi:phospholipase-like protein [Tanacetum coccineum]
MAAGIPPSSPHLHRYPCYHLHSMPPSPPSPPTVYHHLLHGTAVDTLSMPPTRHQQPPQIHLITHVNIITSAGLSAAKPPSWWRSDDGTATTAAPCGVGLWRRNPSGVPRCAQPLDATAVAAAEPAVATTATTAAPWAFGFIWFLESSCVTDRWWSKLSKEIPRGCFWSKHLPFQKWEYFGQLFPNAKKPNYDLYPNRGDSQSEWSSPIEYGGLFGAYLKELSLARTLREKDEEAESGCQTSTKKSSLANKDVVNELVDDFDDSVDEVGYLTITLNFGCGTCGILDNRVMIGQLDMEQVFIPRNEPKRHWSLAQFHIQSGNVTFDDSQKTYDVEYHLWYVKMRSCLESKLPVLLHHTSVFTSKGIDPTTYSIKFSYAQNVLK